MSRIAAASRVHATIAPTRIRVSRIRSALVLTTMAAVLLVGSGCSTRVKGQLDDAGPAYVPRNLGGAQQWPAHVVRVAVLPAADATGTLPADFIASFNGPWLDALQQSQRAEMVSVNRDTYRHWTGSPHPLVSTSRLPADWATRVKAGTGANAALLLDVTRCSPYPPLALGLRAKLIDLETGELIWAVDEFFDAADPEVARAARRYARAGQLSREGDAIAILQSPSRFAQFVSDTLIAALPPR